MNVWKPAAGVALALALAASGCGGGGKKSDSTSTAAAPSGNDATAVLDSISTNTASAGPQKVDLNLSVGVQGKPTNPQIAAFVSKPITLTVQGVADTGAKKTDVTFTLAAGPLNFTGGLRQSGDQGWVELNGKWYTLPPSALSSTAGGTTSTASGSKVDPQQLIAAFGKPSSFIKNAKLVGTEDVGGVKTDHVTGDIDIAALVQGLSKAMTAVGSSTSSPVSPTQLSSSAQQLQQYIKGATVDIYVGQSDHFIHKLATKIDGTLPASTQAQQGISGFNVNFDVSSVGASSPDVSAPSNPAPFSQLQTDMAGLLGGGLPTG